LLLSIVPAGDIDRQRPPGAQQQWRPSTLHSSKLRLTANARSATLDSQRINECEMGYVFFKLD